jgi:hypothetical protein
VGFRVSRSGLMIYGKRFMVGSFRFPANGLGFVDLCESLGYRTHSGFTV